MIAVLLGCGMLVTGAVFAQEAGAELVLEGTTTTQVGGQSVPSSRQRETVIVAGAGFDANELVGLWVTLPDGSVLGLDEDDLRANADGVFAVEVGLGAGLPTGLHRFTARGQVSGNGAIAPFYLLAGRGPSPTEGTRLSFNPSTARQLDTVALFAEGFSANERVSLWVTLPDGAVVGLGEIDANAGGVIDGSLFLPGELPVGRHYFTARGNTSGNTAITPFVLQYGNGLNVPGASVAADIGRAPQRSVIELTIEGQDFMARESVSFWLTLPSGAVLGLGDVLTDSDGNLNVLLDLDETLPVGTHYLSFRSNLSNQGGFARLFLEPGPPEGE